MCLMRMFRAQCHMHAWRNGMQRHGGGAGECGGTDGALHGGQVLAASALRPHGILNDRLGQQQRREPHVNAAQVARAHACHLPPAALRHAEPFLHAEGYAGICCRVMRGSMRLLGACAVGCMGSSCWDEPQVTALTRSAKVAAVAAGRHLQLPRDDAPHEAAALARPRQHHLCVPPSKAFRYPYAVCR
jgi:hypothetical protein